ncbi:MAG: GIY-YIG nuclease family protein [Verrucomicrobia bacterium]|nr:GIY-YIG nuclease family protein [Verrucomicrobiota bacterium]
MSLEIKRKLDPSDSILPHKKQKKSKTVEKVEQVAYPVFRSPTSSRIRFGVPKGVGRAIYRFEKMGRKYVGKTEDLDRRLSKYSSDAYLSDQRPKAGKRAQFLQDLQRSPGKFTVSVLKEVDPEEDIYQPEEAFIQSEEAVEKGYNTNRRGGGPKIEEDADPFVPPEKVVTTPERQFSMKSYGPEMTPTTSRIKYVVYLAIDQETRKRYVGSCTRENYKRIREHFNGAFNPNYEGYNRPMSRAIRAGHEMKVSILYEADSYKKLLEAETFYIQKEKEKHPLFNGNNGRKAKENCSEVANLVAELAKPMILPPAKESSNETALARTLRFN